jgi:DNA-binding transcriptional LysR family regulator
MFALMQRPVRLPAAPYVWDDVRLFLVLYRSRTMVDAASKLGVNVSTVSRRLGALEEALDCVLFDRGRDGLRSTPAADDLLPKAELVEHGVAQFANVVDGLERQVSGVVRLTCPSDVADVIVLPVLRGLFNRHPGLRVALEPGESTVDLNRREADLALRVVRPTRGDLVVKRVRTVQWRAAASRALAARLRAADSFWEWPWIGWGDRLRSTPAARWLEEHVTQAPVLCTDSLSTHIAAAAAGLGVALLPAPSIAHYRLAELELAADVPPPPDNELYLVTHRSLRSVPRIRVVWEALAERFAA